MSASTGAVGMGVAIVAGGMAMGYWDASNAGGHCRPNYCDAEGMALLSASRNAGNVVTAASIVSALPLIAGIGLALSSPKPKHPRARVTAGLHGIELRMTW